MSEERVVCITRRGYNGTDFTAAAKEAFAALCAYLTEHSLWDRVGSCLGITPDDPTTTDHDSARFQAGFFLTGEHEPQGEATIEHLAGGRYAVFTHRGPYDRLNETWRSIYREWLPASGLQLRVAAPYEAYLTDPEETAPEDLLTEIRVPILDVDDVTTTVS